MSDARSVAASATLGVIRYAEALKLSTSAALEAAGLSGVDLEAPEARVPEAAHNRVWQVLTEASGDPDFGLHFAERLSLASFDVVGHLFLRSATVEAGLARVVAFSRILHDAGRVEMERRGDRVVIFPGCRGLTHPFPRQIAELAAASVLVLLRHATGQRLEATRVAFRHPEPPGLSEHRRILGVRPAFLTPETEVELPASVLALPIRGADPSVLTYLDRYAQDVLAKLPSDDLLSQVERAIAQAMGQGLPEMEDIAKQLGLSPRTLQRRLAKLEVSYQSLLDRVRRRFAERYLSASRLSMGEIAFLLGFSELSNFHRAFRRWTGQTPGHYRELSAASLAAQGEPPLS